MLLTLLIILVATDSSSQQSSRYQLYTSAAVSKYLINILLCLLEMKTFYKFGFFVLWKIIKLSKNMAIEMIILTVSVSYYQEIGL